MEGKTLVLLAARAFQLLCAIVVVGTSANLTKVFTEAVKFCSGEGCGILKNFVPRIEFGIFVGALGMIDAAAGIISAFKEIIPYIFQLGIDVLAGLSYVAGGAVIAAWLAQPFVCTGSGGKYCTEIKADDAFMFLGFLVTLVIIGLSFMWRGKRSGSSYV